MSMKRNSSSDERVVDGKIYVAGDCEDEYLSNPNWTEVFDPKTQTWENVTNPHIFELHHQFRDKAIVAKSFELEGKLYMFGDVTMIYNPKEGSWNPIADWPISWALEYSFCVIDNVLFYYWNWNKLAGTFQWYDFKVRLWKVLKDCLIVSTPKICKMVDLGGKMAVLWEEYAYTQKSKEVRICCALEKRRDGHEIWGKVEWSNVLLIVSKQEECMYASFDALYASV